MNMPTSSSRRGCGLVLEQGTDAIEYPKNALDGILGAAARAIADGAQIAPAIAGQSVLAAAALVAQGLAEVTTATGRKPLSLNLLTVALSGDGKSAADGPALAPIRKIEREEYTNYQQQRTKWESRPKSERPEKLINPLRLVADFTAEGLIRQFREGRSSLGAFSDEAGAVFGGHSFSAEKKLATAAAISSLWDGTGIRARARASDDRGGLEAHFNARLTAHWLIQPAAAADVLNDTILAEQGFWPRVLLATPAPGNPRVYRPFVPEANPDLRTYWDRLAALLRLPELVPEQRPLLCFTAKASDRLAAYFEAMESVTRGAEGRYTAIRSWGARATEQLCRVAGVLAVIERGPETEIRHEEVAAAEELVSYSLECWLRQMEQQPEIEARDYATRLLHWLAKQPGQQSTGRAMLRIGPKPRSAGMRDAALAILEGERRVVALGGDKWKAGV
ncbi:MAG: DUF3987 domain-containing protein [Pseudomonadota bacterium]|nr:DUF3987 domain-containing protein [Pseudomonadota bacterium]